MKTFILLIILLFTASVRPASRVSHDDDLNVVFDQLATELKSIIAGYHLRLDKCEDELLMIRQKLKSATTTDEKVELLIRRDTVLEAIHQLNINTDAEVSKVRYLKGLQIVKILYEKVLSLDHHFASVRTLNEINKLSNPNQYPEYSKLKDIVAGKRDKKSGFDLSSILAGNTIVSIVQTITSMVDSGMSREEKEKQLAAVECILDFTLRMQNDLNTIYFETSFLHTSNDNIKQDIEVLFRDYTKPIGYTETLDSCRTNDDWETVTAKMDEYLNKMKSTSGSAQYKMRVNFDFPIDRLLQFISQYNSFIAQGGQFYEKFRIILNSYENGAQCESKLPTEYTKLKSDIDVAINKFNVAYKPVEVNGTKMKEILYGLNEFE